MIRPVQNDLYAVIGKPVAHSLSPIMMNRAFDVLGVRASYLAFEMDDPNEELDVLHRIGVKGLSVTIPHKQTAMQACERLDATARSIGAVNTLRSTNGAWEGRNTDWLGVTQALGAVTSLPHKKALVIGAGGSARAAAYGLLHEEAQVVITNRSEQRGRELADSLGCGFVAMDEAGRLPCDLVVHCTPVGMQGRERTKLLPDSFFRPEMVVMDAVYRPLWTNFLVAAKRAGCRIVNGLEMLLYQGVAQLEWWLGCEAPVAEMRSALMDAIDEE